jgi:hypothetical protein
MCLNYILIKFTPSIVLPPHSLPVLRTISTGFIILFPHINAKYIHHILPLLPFPYAQPLLLIPTPRQDLFYLSAFHFFKVYIDSSWRFCFHISDLYISCFNQCKHPSLLTLSISSCSPIIQHKLLFLRQRHFVLYFVIFKPIYLNPEIRV